MQNHHTIKGRELEKSIEKWFKYLEQDGIHCHKNHPQRTIDGKFVRGEPFDYEIFSNGRLLAFDAKECKGKKWNLKNAKLHQVKALYDIERHGGDGFFLVYFKPDLVKFKASQIKEMLENGIKSAEKSDGEKVCLTSIK